MTAAFQSSAFQNNAFQVNGGSIPDGPPLGGKGDNDGIYKPTGLIDRPARKEGRKEVADRVDESREIEAEIAGRLAREFGEETLRLRKEPPPVVEMTPEEVDWEIGILLRKKMRTEEDELLLLLLMAAAVV